MNPSPVPIEARLALVLAGLGAVVGYPQGGWLGAILGVLISLALPVLLLLGVWLMANIRRERAPDPPSGGQASTSDP